MTRQTAYTSKRKADSENELSLVEFVDLIFEELGDKWKFKRARTIDYSSVMCSVYWRETIIPCVTELNEMAQTDSTIFEFLVAFLSQFDIGKDSSKDFGTIQMFYSLKSLKTWQSKIILSRIEGVSEQDVSQLQCLLEDNNPEDFVKVLRSKNNFHSIIERCSVLCRFNSLRLIYASITKNPDTDSLGKLFLLIEEYIRYFSFQYDHSNRLCDGIIYDLLCILDKTRRRKYSDDFCEVARYIGECCISGLILFYCIYKNQMPISVRDVFTNIVLGDYSNDLNLLYPKFNKCNTNEKKIAFLKAVGNDMETKFYRFLYKFMDPELAQRIPLMQELSTAIVEHPFIEPFLLETNQPVLSKSEEATAPFSTDHNLAVNHSGLSPDGKKWKLQKYLRREIDINTANRCVGLKQSIVDMGDGKLTKFIKGIAEMGFFDGTTENMNAFAYILTGRSFRNKTGTVEWRKDYKKVGDNEGLYILLWMSLRMFEDAPHGQKYTQLFDALGIANNFKNPSASAEHSCIEGFRNLVKECFNMDA